MKSRKSWLATTAFGAVAAAMVGVSVLPVPEQPVFAQTAGPPPLSTPTSNMIPGTEITPIANGIIAYIPSSNGTVDLPTQAGTVRLELRDVVGPVTVQIQGEPAGLLAYDAQGNSLAVTEVSTGLYLVNQPS